MASNQEEQIKQLKQKRVVFTKELTNFEVILGNYKEGESITRIQYHLTDIETKYETYNENQTELDEIEQGQLLDERMAIEHKFLQCKADAVDLIEKIKKQSANRNMTNSRSISYADIVANESVLPMIQIPTFSGAYADWPGFADQFRSTIHNNYRIDNCKKLIYLRSCLKHEAADAIASLSNTAVNYPIAWEILEKLYDRPAKIVHNHLKALFEIPPLEYPSHQGIKTYVNKLETHYKALQAINQPAADTILLYLFTSKLDSDTQLKWKERIEDKSSPNVRELFKFLHSRANILEPMTSIYQTQPRPATHAYTVRKIAPSLTYLSQPQSVCNVCNGPHAVWNCNKFLSLSVPERSKHVREKNLCYNCLRDTHSLDTCIFANCMICRKNHHTLLHADRENSGQPNQTDLACLSPKIRLNVMLSTAIINIRDQTGNMQLCRVLLDSGSQAHLLTNEACKRLRLPTQRVNIPLCGANQMQSQIHQMTRARIQSRVSDYQAEITFLIMDKISQTIPSIDIDKDNLNLPEHIPLADPMFYRSSHIDGLIGAQLFWDLLCEEKLFSTSQNLQLRNTVLGWIVTGETVAEKQLQESFKGYNTEEEQKLADLLKGAQEEREPLLQKQEELISEVKSLRTASEVRAAETERLTKCVHFLESSMKTASIERMQLDMELAEARQVGANRNIEINRLAMLLQNALAKIKELEQSRQGQVTECKQFQTDLLRTVRVANDFKTENQSELKQVMMENKAQRVQPRALEAQLDKLNKVNQTVIQQPQQRLSVKCLIESIENAIKQTKAGPGNRNSSTFSLNSIGTNDTMTLNVPFQWPMGRIISLHPGTGGIVQVVRSINEEYKSNRHHHQQFLNEIVQDRRYVRHLVVRPFMARTGPFPLLGNSELPIPSRR